MKIWMLLAIVWAGHPSGSAGFEQGMFETYEECAAQLEWKESEPEYDGPPIYICVEAKIDQLPKKLMTLRNGP